MSTDLEDEVDPPLVVVAEDDDAMRSLLAASLRADGYDVLEARDGAELAFLVHAARSVPRAQARPALVLSDIRMPLMSGIEALRRLRTERSDVRFLFLSGFADDQARDEARTLGAVAVLSKPFDLRLLRGLVAELVSQVTT
jgi:CheY-like chemotaxis protein